MIESCVKPCAIFLIGLFIGYVIGIRGGKLIWPK